jgi:hypothetical protein
MTVEKIMKWSHQQAEALQKVSAWRARHDSPYFLLAGYAGTGKSIGNE